MHYSTAVFATLAAHAAAHGVITRVKGANGVTMPGLSVSDGVPRDSPSPTSGAEDDTSIIRDNELGTDEASALGRTADGPVDAAAAVEMFMSGTGPNKGVTNNKNRRRARRGLLDGLLGGGDGGDAPTSEGTETAAGTTENIVAKKAGTGAKSGMPTTNDDGSIDATFHQVNQDGAGPLTAMVDGTSGGKDVNAFQEAKVMQDVPGIGIGGLSGAQTTDFPIKVQMPQGMTCDAKMGGAKNVCVMKVQNDALAGPFGGSAAFTQSAAARKRAIEYRLRKRHIARGTLAQEDSE